MSALDFWERLLSLDARLPLLFYFFFFFLSHSTPWCILDTRVSTCDERSPSFTTASSQSFRGTRYKVSRATTSIISYYYLFIYLFVYLFSLRKGSGGGGDESRKFVDLDSADDEIRVLFFSLSWMRYVPEIINFVRENFAYFVVRLLFPLIAMPIYRTKNSDTWVNYYFGATLQTFSFHTMEVGVLVLFNANIVKCLCAATLRYVASA